MRRSTMVLIQGLLCSMVVIGHQKPTPPGLPVPVREIIQKFAAAESENKSVKNNYTYTQDYEVVSLGPGDTVTGRFRRISDIVYGDDGRPIEKIITFPPSSLTEVRVTYEDIQDLTGIQPFALTLTDVVKYQIDYVGEEQLDKLPTYVFDVKPLQIRKSERYLLGRVWVDENDLQIVKVVGRAVPETGDQKFPHFETRRQRIDGRFWFPTYTNADDTLKFKGGVRAHIRMTIRYTNYKKFTTAIRLAENDEVAPPRVVKKGKGTQLSQISPTVDAHLSISGPADSDDQRRAQQLNIEVFKLAGEGKYNEAIPKAEQMLATVERSRGPDHPDVALSLKTLASIYFSKGELAKAEPLLQRALAIWEKKLGQDHPDLEQPLGNLASVYLAKKDYSRAEVLLVRALAIKEKAIGRDHLDLKPFINNLANLYRAKGDFGKAESLLQRALDISEKATDQGQAEVADSLSNLAELYQFQGKYAGAETLYKRALAITEKVSGPENPEVATSLDNLAALYQFQGKYAEAESLSNRALMITEKALGPEHIAVAGALTNLAELYTAQGKYAQVEPLYKRAFNISEKSFGAEQPDVLPSLANLALFYFGRGKYAESEVLLKRAFAILERAVGTEHKYVAIFTTVFATMKDFYQYRYAEDVPLYKQTLVLTEKMNDFLKSVEKDLDLESPDFAPSLYKMGLLHRAQGRYTEAERLCKRALAITESQLGPYHPEVAAALINLVGIYRDQGKYEEVEPLYKRALAIYEKALGSEHPDVAQSLIDLGDLYHLQGKYAEAERLYKRALAIYEKVLGGDHPSVANCLNSLGSLAQKQGRFAEAESQFKRAIAINEKALGAAHSDVSPLNNLAVLYLAQHKYSEAEPLFKRSLDDMGKSFGPEHPRTALAIRNVATLYIYQRKFAEAEPLFKSALAIYEKALGSGHPDVAMTLNNLATLYSGQGKYAEAEALLKRALTIIEKALGPEHTTFVVGLNNLSVLSLARGDITKAIDYLSRSADAREQDFKRNLVAGSEREKVLYINQSASDLHQTISLHTQSAPDDPNALRLALTVLLRRKSRSLDLMADSFSTLRRHMDPQARALLDNFTEASSRLATLVLGGPARMNPAQYRAEVSRLERQVEELQGEISARSDQFRTQSQPVTIRNVQSAIPPGSALVEFCYYYPLQITTMRAGAPRYVAYIIRNQGEPGWVDLGEADAIDGAVDALRRALRNPVRDDVKQLARAVDERLMKPVRKLLGQTTRVFISPDGVLNLIPFEALVDEQGQYLIERYSITYLTSGRDLLHLQTHLESRQESIIIANPDFDDDGSPLNQAAPASQKPGGQRASDLAGAYFKPLPATAQEATALEAILSGSKVLTASQATESAVKQVQSPRILHIATHGFFLTDQKQEARDTRELVQIAPEPGLQSMRIENPFFRSGLALAGANKRKSGGEDGILTALEASALDLWGTKLVVLSACNTGVGEAKNSEGVYGLRRALTLAGSETQVMSLWSVSDAATRDLMVDFYKGLKAGQGRNEALRQVQLKMLHNAARSHPFYWASFIQSGEWAGLDGKRPE